MQTILLTLLAMIAFAANSLICRAALGGGLIDAGSFTALRILSGALLLSFLLAPRWWGQRGPAEPWRGNFLMAAMLSIYMLGFSLAYQSLSAATGALLLFGMVQLTMFAWSLSRGARFDRWGWVGLVLAVSGLVLLLLPGVAAPSLAGAVMMGLAGVAWGVYSLLGARRGDPVVATAKNFLLACPLGLLAWWWLPMATHLTATGVALAVLSGTLASGLGYVIWYAALKKLAALPAATVQLSVPVIAALGGAVLLSEPLSLRLVLASMITLGGIALILIRREQKKEAP